MNEEQKRPDDLQPETPPDDDIKDDVFADVADAVADDVTDDIVADVVADAVVDDVIEDAPTGQDATDIPDFGAIDVDSALAAIADLTTLTAEETDETEVASDDEDLTHEATEDDLPQTVPPVFVRPPLSTLKRGQMASVLPALTLILTGLALTYALMDGITFDASFLPSLTIAGLGVMGLAHWISSRRWAQGSLLIGLLLITSALAFYLWQQPEYIAMWYIVPTAWAVAFVLTGIFGHAHNSRLLLMGACLLIVGLMGWLITGDVLPPETVTALANLAPVALVLVVVWILVPARRS